MCFPKSLKPLLAPGEIDHSGRKKNAIYIFISCSAVPLSVSQLNFSEEDLAALRFGDDIKTVQENLGHATASFTLDVYGHVTEQMKQASANRMETYIKNVLGQ